MAFQLSPGVNVSEIDLTTVVPSVATSDGAFAGVFRWGPVGERTLISTENQLVALFGKPTNHNPETFFTAANFLSYSNRLHVVRAANTTGPTPSVVGNTFGGGPVISGVYTGSGTGYDNNDILTAKSALGTNATFSMTTNSTGGSVILSLTNAGSGFTVENIPVSNLAITNSSGGTAAGNNVVTNFTVTANPEENVILISNTLPLKVGMKLNQCSNSSITFGNSTVNNSVLSTVTITSKNSSSITLSSPITASQNLVTYWFTSPESTYAAVGLDPTTPRTKAGANGIVDNLVGHIVKNNNDYDNKDGTFDPDVNWIAKYPGEIGNSLRISVCDTANSFSSNISLSNTSVNTSIEFRIGSNEATVKFIGSGNTSANTVATNISINDQILAGNSVYGFQYLQVKSMTVNGNNTANVSVQGLTDISNTTNFITVANNPFSNGDVVRYVNAASNSVIIGLASNSTVNTYHVVQANALGFKLSNTPFGEEIDITAAPNTAGVFTANVNVLTIQFSNPYRLRANFTDNTIQRYWEFFNVVDSAPGQSEHVLLNGNTAAQDELHVVVVDELGKFTGTPGTILESYKALSRATDSKGIDGTNLYYKDVINQVSNYIWWANDRTTAPSATSALVASATSPSPGNIPLVYGADGSNEETVNISVLAEGYDLFSKAEDIDISLVLQGKPIGGVTVVNGETVRRFQLANYIVDNIVNTRRDCIALVSPDRDTVLNNTGREANSLKNWRGAVTSSSYAVLDSGYKYQYDRYNDLYRWIPMNGDIAGLCARTDDTNDAWWSPAGYNRGQIKNIVKLAFNPNKSERDVLYSNGVNPVVTFPGQGTVLYGDKTLQAKPSAFDRINVRRLFIVLEKAISTAAKYSLFEFNDAFTRAQFRNLVTPYLRTIQGRRGITDFKVVCDDTNNTAQIIDSNQFIGDIYIKPARSINFIQLNFIAVPTGVQFTEVVGKF